jgi:hypothetical protein
MGGVIDMVGKVFGRWRVIERGENYRRREAAWLCVCECGAVRVVLGYALRSGRSRSCNCLKEELQSKRMVGSKIAVRHGHSALNRRTREYRAWCVARRAYKGVPRFPAFLKLVGRAPNRNSKLRHQKDGSFQWSN